MSLAAFSCTAASSAGAHGAVEHAAAQPQSTDKCEQDEPCLTHGESFRAPRSFSARPEGAVNPRADRPGGEMEILHQSARFTAVTARPRRALRQPTPLRRDGAPFRDPTRGRVRPRLGRARLGTASSGRSQARRHPRDERPVLDDTDLGRSRRTAWTLRIQGAGRAARMNATMAGNLNCAGCCAIARARAVWTHAARWGPGWGAV